jgi:hypothetical protein
MGTSVRNCGKLQRIQSSEELTSRTVSCSRRASCRRIASQVLCGAEGWLRSNQHCRAGDSRLGFGLDSEGLVSVTR